MDSFWRKAVERHCVYGEFLGDAYIKPLKIKKWKGIE